MGKQNKKNSARKYSQLRKAKVNSEINLSDKALSQSKIDDLIPQKEVVVTEEKVKRVPNKKGVLFVVSFVFVLIAAIITYILLPKFHDLTVELGTESISIAEFMNKYAIGSKVSFVTDPQTIEIDHVGETSIVLRQGNREETVKLTIVDTTVPEVKYIDYLESGLSTIPDASAFVTEIIDYDTTTVEYRTDVSAISEYGNYEIEVVVSDASGNETAFTSTLSCVWLKKEAVFELGTTIKENDLLLEGENAGALISKQVIDKLNKSGIGEYVIESTTNNQTLSCKVIIQDTTPPTLKLRNVTIYETQKASMNDFISKAWDASGEVHLKLLTTLNLKTVGKQNVQIEASDNNGNSIVQTALLTIKKDDVPPVIKGLSTLTVNKHSNPNYKSGVSAYDAIDGSVTFTVDTSNVNVDKAGTYYATYTATDTKGNKAVSKRKIVVNHNYEDTNELLDKLYASISDKSPKGIAEYVRKYIEYSSSWGGSDPAWYGLTQRNGNCYVHTIILKEMLNRAGYSNSIIWVNSKAHYWNLVYYNGNWWHLDATYLQGKPPVMCNDEEKYKYCVSRGWGDWDRSKWPACNG